MSASSPSRAHSASNVLTSLGASRPHTIPAPDGTIYRYTRRYQASSGITVLQLLQHDFHNLDLGAPRFVEAVDLCLGRRRLGAQLLEAGGRGLGPRGQAPGEGGGFPAAGRPPP